MRIFNRRYGGTEKSFLCYLFSPVKLFLPLFLCVFLLCLCAPLIAACYLVKDGAGQFDLWRAGSGECASGWAGLPDTYAT
jgi:hypothetical protein